MITKNMEADWSIGLGALQDHMEEIVAIVEKNDDLTKKLGVFMGDPAPGGEDDEPKEIRSEDYMMVVMMTMKTKLERISWSLPPIKISSRPPYDQ